MTDPHSDPRTDSRLTTTQLADWLHADSSLERLEFERLSVLAGIRPDLEPLIRLLLESYHRRAATGYKWSVYLRDSAPAAPAAPPAPPGWWGRVRMAWIVLFPGR